MRTLLTLLATILLLTGGIWLAVNPYANIPVWIAGTGVVVLIFKTAALSEKGRRLMPYGDNDPYITPREAAGAGFRWLPVIIIAVVVLVGAFVALYITVLAPAGNQIDAANQRNQVNHLHRQVAVQNAQNQVTYQSIGYQDAQIADMRQNLVNITGPAGLALTRAGLAQNDPEQQTLQASEDDQVNSFCGEGVKVAPSNPEFTSGSPSLKDLYAANCTAGTEIANPPLARNPIPGNGA